MTATAWRDPDLHRATEAWLRSVAADQRIDLVGPIEQVHVRPWSTVFRAPASPSALFLKVESIVQAHEPRLIELIARSSPDLVPALVAVHPSEPWVILRDGGMRLRAAHPGFAQLAVWRALLPRYAELQRALLGRERELLSTGLPDRRLERFPALIERVLDDGRWSAPEPRSRVRALVPKIQLLCEELAAFAIGPTLDHDDLHDHNVLVDGGRATIIDWGDASLTHPFLTLAVTLRFAAEAAGLATAAPEIRILRDAYLEPWTTLAPAAALRRAADIGAALGILTGGLTWYEIVTRLPGAHDAEPTEMTTLLERIAGAVAAL
jgi:hypothetical protein